MNISTGFIEYPDRRRIEIKTDILQISESPTVSEDSKVDYTSYYHDVFKEQSYNFTAEMDEAGYNYIKRLISDYKRRNITRYYIWRSIHATHRPFRYDPHDEARNRIRYSKHRTRRTYVLQKRKPDWKQHLDRFHPYHYQEWPHLRSRTQSIVC